MFISCPNCDTTFSLPDDLYKPGKKARCSQCGNIFPMPDKAAQDFDPLPGIGESIASPAKSVTPRKSDKLRPALLLGAALVLLLGLGYGGWLMLTSSGGTPPGAQTANGSSPVAGEKAEDIREAALNDRIKDISLEEVRQFLVDNMTVGKIMVIQGLAMNKSESNRDYITVEARVLDDNGKVLAEHTQVCGAPLTLFQLQSLSEAELKQALNNRITILTNNVQVPPGGKVPFVVIFPNPPQEMRRFEVRVVDVRESPPQ